MNVKGFEARLARTAILSAIVVVVALVVGRIMIANRTDHQTQQREEEQASHGMAGWVDGLESRIAGQADWDDAVQHLGLKYDQDWARSNVGQFFSDMVGVERAYVIDPQGRPLYAMTYGKTVAPAGFSEVAGGAAPLVAEVRRKEALRPLVRGKPPFEAMLSKPIQASAIRIVNGEPYALTATLVQNDFGRVRGMTKAPIIVTGEALDGNFVAQFSDRFLLKNLHIHPTGASADEPDEAHVLLTDARKAPVARMDWTPQRPGRQVLLATMPPLLACLLIVGALGVSLFRRGRRAAQQLVASESRSIHMAFHDALTGLPNRALFNDRVGHALAGLERSGAPVGVLSLDLDHFKEVNDALGHAAGDELLVEVASRLIGICRGSDTLVRLGGDEFALLQSDATTQGLAAVAERILSVLSGPVDLASGRVYLGASIGIALIAQPGVDPGEILRLAELAMYKAKGEGRARYCFFEPDMDLGLRARKSLEADLRAALEAGDLTMAYQPQVDGVGRIVGVEALVRWNHPERGPVSPAYFVPIAEECGLIGALGTFTLRQAFTDGHRWPSLKVAVNVSAIQLRTPGFAALVAEIVRETRANPSHFELEITEGVLLSDDEQTHQTLKHLRNMGFSMALDDFGTGYSSLAYLRRYPVDKIKIDRSFVMNLGVERDADAVIGAIVRLAKALDLKVIAEGVETEAQRSGLKRAGCAHIQGYLFSRPVTADEIGPLLEVAVAPLRRAS